MARLQDFQSVTPSSSDNLLIVQATGQGLVNYGSTIGNKALKSDLASISITGTTNNTGSTIAKNQFFYLNGTLVRATTDIANGATLTSGTNYTGVTSGAVNWMSLEYQCPLSTSTTSFQSIDPYSKTTTLYMGGVLDLLHSNINNYTDSAVSNIYLARGGPAYGITLMKVNNIYFSGMIWGYHDSCWNTIWMFSYKNGTYSLRPMAYII